MAELPQTQVDSFPFIGVEEIMDRFGINETSSYFDTYGQAKAFVGRELVRATSAVKVRCGWQFIASEDIPDDKKSVIADVIYARVARYYYQRLAGISTDRDEHFRILSNKNRDEFEFWLNFIMKSKWYSDIVTYPKTHRTGRIPEE